MTSRDFFLLVEGEPERTEKLAAGLVNLGVEAVRVADLAEAIGTAKAGTYPIRGILVPASASTGPLRKAMKSLRRREPALPALAFGPQPRPEEAKALRKAGVLLALWDGYDDGRLRFQVNRMRAAEAKGPERAARRVPLRTPVQIAVGGREKQGTLYSLAAGGCFVETPRASMDGAQVRVQFSVEGRAFELPGQVVFANVPGNLQRPNLPLGMGVRFERVPDAARSDLEQSIQNISETLEI